MFRIGDFSRIARVSARLLRFYDEIGLLTPARADPQTGYRYYTMEQLAALNRIVVCATVVRFMPRRRAMSAFDSPASTRPLMNRAKSDGVSAWRFWFSATWS
jgi:hypothetical protein